MPHQAKTDNLKISRINQVSNIPFPEISELKLEPGLGELANKVRIKRRGASGPEEYENPEGNKDR